MTRSISSVPGFAGDAVHPDSADYDSAARVSTDWSTSGPALCCTAAPARTPSPPSATVSALGPSLRCSGHSVA